MRLRLSAFLFNNSLTRVFNLNRFTRNSKRQGACCKWFEEKIKYKTMKNINNIDELKDELECDTLSVFCFDSVDVQSRVTFDFSWVQDVQVTYWMEDSADVELRINGVFDILFEEVIKTR